MTRFILQVTAAAICAVGAAACASTPNYPVKQGYVAPTPVQPQYPVQAPPPSAQPADGHDAAATQEPTAAPPPASVDSQALPPVAAPPPGQAEAAPKRLRQGGCAAAITSTHL